MINCFADETNCSSNPCPDNTMCLEDDSEGYICSCKDPVHACIETDGK